MGRVSALRSASARLSLARLYARFAFGSLPHGPGRVRASVATASTLRSTIDEYLQATASTEQAATLRDFADKPLIVLTAGIGIDAALAAAQNRMARLSTSSVHRIIDGASHEIWSETRNTPPPPLGRSSTSSHRSGAKGALAR